MMRVVWFDAPPSLSEDVRLEWASILPSRACLALVSGVYVDCAVSASFGMVGLALSLVRVCVIVHSVRAWVVKARVLSLEGAHVWKHHRQVPSCACVEGRQSWCLFVARRMHVYAGACGLL